MTSLFSSWLVHPLLLAAGAALIAAPILIHLLNRRKFRIVEWAAMDFLLEADQRNRRRIQIEELLLLALRCLAVLLAGLLVARPFLPSGLSRGWLAAVRHERIVLLDDSPSMTASAGGRTPFDLAKVQLAEFVAALAQSGAGDSLTLILTSQPKRPVLVDVPVNDRTAPELVQEIESLTAADLPSRIGQACVDARGLLGDQASRINRVVYVLTDLRRGDWWNEPSADGAVAPEPADAPAARVPPVAALESLKALADDAAGCFVVDLGENAPAANLSIEEVAPQDQALLAGVAARFRVVVRNHGSETIRNVPVRFIAGGTLPLTATIDSAPAGGTGAVPFSYMTAPVDDDGAPPEPLEVRAELGERSDALDADNVGYFAGRVRAGIPTLIVDGDPSSEYGQSEGFFLQRALAPPGTHASGIQVETIGDAEFETRSLAAYQVVHLCNVYHLSEQRRTSLEAWVRTGGGLVFWPGAQIDDRRYNEDLYKDGAGLLPGRLSHVAGDETEKAWVSFSIDQATHPALGIFEGEAAPLLESAKIFQWWRLDDPPAGTTLAPSVLRFTDADRSPALVEKTFGQGRVVLFTVPADTAWSNWPEDASYLILLQELNRHLARSAARPAGIAVGEPLRLPLDVAQFRPEVLVERPDGAAVTRQAAPAVSSAAVDRDAENGAENGAESVKGDWIVGYDETGQRGFYRMQLTTLSGETQTRLFAANLDPREGDLQRIEAESLERAWEGAPIRLVRETPLAELAIDGGRGEMWIWVLVALMATLFVEQTLAWTFGRSR